MSALEGVRVLELATASLGVAYAGLLLAELGADVVKLEPPSGDPSRPVGPFASDSDQQNTGATFVYANRGKRSATLALEHNSAAPLLRRLAGSADVLLDDLDPPTRQRLSLTPDALASTSLIHVSLRPFGSFGDWSAKPSTPLVVAHASGESFINPSGLEHLDRAPLKLAGHAQEFDSGSVAALIALTGLFEGDTGYRFCDLSEQDVQATMVRPEIVTAFVTGVEETRATRVHEFGGPLRCADGWVHVVIKEAAQWNGLVQLMGSPDWATDPVYQTREARFEEGYALTQQLMTWLLTQRRHDLMRRAQAIGVPIVAIETPEDVLETTQLQERGYLRTLPVDGRTVLAPSPLGVVGLSRGGTAVHAPALGEHTESVYRDWAGLTAAELQAARDCGAI